MAKLKNKNLLSSFFTTLVIGFLLILGPASAVNVTLSAEQSSVIEGNKVSFKGNIDIENAERIPVDNITIQIFDSGDNVVDTCTFDVNGNNLSSCSNFGTISTTIDPTSYGYGYLKGYGYGINSTYMNNIYGYGYGYGYGTYPNELSYSISWVSPSVSENTEYKAKLLVSSNSDKYLTTSTTSVIVIDSSSGSGGGSNKGRSVSSEVLNELAEKLGVPGLQNAKEIVTKTRQAKISSEEDIKAITNMAGASEETKAYINRLKATNKAIDYKYTVYEAEDENGKKIHATKISIELPNKKGEKVILVIPKEITESATNIKGNFKTLIDDPVIELTDEEDLIFEGNQQDEMSNIQVLSVFDEEAITSTNNEEEEKVSEVEKKQIKEEVSEEKEIVQDNKTIPQEKTEDKTNNGKNLETPATGKFTFNTPTIIGTILGLLIIAGLIFFFIKRKKE